MQSFFHLPYNLVCNNLLLLLTKQKTQFSVERFEARECLSCNQLFLLTGTLTVQLMLLKRRDAVSGESI